MVAPIPISPLGFSSNYLDSHWLWGSFGVLVHQKRSPHEHKKSRRRPGGFCLHHGTGRVLLPPKILLRQHGEPRLLQTEAFPFLRLHLGEQLFQRWILRLWMPLKPGSDWEGFETGCQRPVNFHLVHIPFSPDFPHQGFHLNNFHFTGASFEAHGKTRLPHA